MDKISNQIKPLLYFLETSMNLSTDLSPDLWCKLEITDFKTFISEIFILTLNILIGIALLYSLRRTFLFPEKLKDKRFVYWFILGWWVCEVSKTILGMVVYHQYVAQEISPEEV